MDAPFGVGTFFGVLVLCFLVALLVLWVLLPFVVFSMRGLLVKQTAILAEVSAVLETIRVEARGAKANGEKAIAAVREIERVLCAVHQVKFED